MFQAMSLGRSTPQARARAANGDAVGDGVRRLVRIGWMLVGAVIMVAGVAISPLPGPFGLPLAVVGLMIVLRNSMWAKREFVKLKRRHPNFVFPLRRLMRRRPEFAPVFWQQTLRMERLVLKRRRVLARVRRRLFRRRRPATV